jgi:hypothetical protein
MVDGGRGRWLTRRTHDASFFDERREAETAGKDWPRGRGEAAHLSNLKITTDFLDPDYDIMIENLIRGETRLLKVFSLIPNTPAKPCFHARVDDGSSEKRKELELDIDIKGVSESLVRDFKDNRNGYLGHHNARAANPDERIFGVEIATPSGRVFKGQVFFNVTFSESISEHAESKDTLDVEVIRANPTDGDNR